MKVCNTLSITQPVNPTIDGRVRSAYSLMHDMMRLLQGTAIKFDTQQTSDLCFAAQDECDPSVILTA
jgi:hypothetical protein